jgi:GTP-binding protein
MKTPLIAIVGKPNVGKSTLFNRIVGSRIAITADEPGTTRDRIFHKVEHHKIDFFLVDTGGLDFGKGETTIEGDIRLQAEVAVEESDIIIFVIDSKTSLNSDDFRAADMLRKKSNNKPIFIVANKCDKPFEKSELAELYSLGLGEPMQISATHGIGVSALVDNIIKTLKKLNFVFKDSKAHDDEVKIDEKHRNIAIVGKPNVGKSSLINALLNKNKLIVSAIPGTTRDSTDSFIKSNGKDYNFIDTAGLKRPGHTSLGVEKFSALRSMASIERSDVCLLVIDTSERLSHQDQQIANHVIDASKGLVILANKWDIKEEDADEIERKGVFIRKLRSIFDFLPWVPVIFTSAVNRKNLNVIFDQVERILDERNKRISTSELNRFVEKLILDHPPTGKTRIRPKIYYITQAEVNPPLFKIFVNKEKAFHFSYLRYLENRLREKYGFTGTPIRLEYKEKIREER